MKLEFLYRLLKNAQTSNFKKIRPVGAELFNADRQTDMTKLIVAFRNISNALNKCSGPRSMIHLSV